MTNPFLIKDDPTDSSNHRQSEAVKVQEECDISLARRSVISKAKSLGFNTVNTSYLATSVTELASNIVFHATSGGLITISIVEDQGQRGIEISAEDNGPGIADIQLALTDGYSTRGGLGSGLPGVKRLVDEFELLSLPGYGTRVVIRKWLK